MCGVRVEPQDRVGQGRDGTGWLWRVPTIAVDGPTKRQPERHEPHQQQGPDPDQEEDQRLWHLLVVASEECLARAMIGHAQRQPAGISGQHRNESAAMQPIPPPIRPA
jgi:hypothetical protein